MKRFGAIFSSGLIPCLAVALLFCRGLVCFGDPPPPATPAAPLDDSQKKIALPTEPGDHKLKFRTHIGDRPVVLSYLLHLPANYNDGKQHPMLVFFHGIGECGTDLAGIYALGPMTMIKEDGGIPAFAASCPFIILCPQCPPHGETWDTDFIYKAAAQLVDQTIKKTKCDADRVYGTGLSMGGLGSWCVAEENPELFAGVAPLSSMKWNPDDATKLLKFVAVWSIVGVDDQPRFFQGTQEMETALKQGGAARRFTYLYGYGHDAWFPAYANAQFYEWLLAQRKPSPADRKKLETRPALPTTQPLPTSPGHYLCSFQTKLGIQPCNIDYVLYLPKGYKPDAAPMPAMVFLHEQDTIGPDFKDICMHGPDLLLERKPGLQNNFPFIVISPRLPLKCDWETPELRKALLALVDNLSRQLRIDPQRISLTGINAGATGAWRLAMDAPDRFSALIPVITDGNLAPGDDRAALVQNLAGRAFVKSNDNGSITRMTDLIGKTKLDWKLLKLPNNTEALGDISVWSDHQILTWLSQQRGKAATTGPAPTSRILPGSSNNHESAN